MKQNLLTSLSCLCLLLFLAGDLFAQGVTSAGITGVVTDATGEGLPGTNVRAVHEPTGTAYGVATDLNGRYTISNVRVGGPYTITVSFVGYEAQLFENINLKLGQTFDLDVILSESGVSLAEVEVTSSRNPVLNSERTGAATNISDEQLNSLPTISRGLNDFTRLTPQASTAGSGVSFGGQNNRYNQFAIDGTVNNDVFGLSGSGTNGGQTGVQPISLDAIQEVQVAIAPYDVRQGGFTGGGINAITRSGTNRFKGSVYFFGNNERLVGKSPDEERTRLDEYTDYQTGLRLGGPIIKDKLFFFVNGEITERTSPLLFRPGTSSSNIEIAELDRVVDVAERLGYDPGSYGSITDQRSSEKIFGRLDWNINESHQLTLRHSYVYGEELDFSRSPNSVNFSNSGVFFPTTTNTSVLQLNSRIGTSMSNELRIGYTAVRDNRDPLGDPFPSINIRLDGGRSINLGSEAFSVANQLDQDVLTLTNNFTVFRGKHMITFGTHNEFYSTYNLFIRQNYGAYQYNSLEDFETIGTPDEVLPRQYDYSYSRTNNPQQGAEFSAFQLGFYAQDEYQLSREFKLTGGIRLDIPTFNQQPTANPAFNEAFAEYGVATDQVPGAEVMVSPRLGFNWDVTGDKSTQLRGGVGVFTGRIPFVWISNQYTNTGNEFGRVRLSGSRFPEGFTFESDPFNQPTAPEVGLSEGVSEINVTAPDFKFPQVFRTNLAVDQLLPGGIVGTLEGIFTKNMNNIDFKNLNVQEDGRLSGVDNRVYFSDDYANENFNDVILLTNTNLGYSYSLTAQLQKFFESGLNTSIAYTYGQSKDVNGGTSSQAFSNWRYVENINGPNSAELGYSDFDVRSRVVGSFGYELEYWNGWSTSFSLFYNGQSGVPLSYVYNGDINNDGTFGNDLIYVPQDASELTYGFYNRDTRELETYDAAKQSQVAGELNAYIENDEYLNSIRGEYAERNGARLPWTNQFDVRLMQEVGVNFGGATTHRLQFTLDIFNVGNLLNKEWGRQYDVRNNSFSLIDVAGIQENADGTRTPIYDFTGSGLNDGNPYFVNDFVSRWRGQVGVRYIFD
jgi:hypothetical protein